MQDFTEPHLTAIKRTSLSAPTRFLDEEDLLIGRCLDYGCGYGLDAEILGMEMYDPYYHSSFPSGEFDTIVCNYVFNVVHPDEESGVLQAIEGLLRPGGHAYITVRRDAMMDKSRQRKAELDLPVLYEDSRMCIYETWR